MRPTVSIVIPVFNEEASLDELIRRCLSACDGMGMPYEIILVDDGSADSSQAKILEASRQNPGKIVGVFLTRNSGQHSAVRAGFSESRGDIVVTLDADLQNLPEEIPRLVEKIREGYDVVGTVRMPRHDSLFRKFFSQMVNKAVQRVTGVMMHDYGCMLRAYRREIVDAMLQCHERSTFIPILANSFARKTTEIEVKHASRAAGKSKYSVWKLINLQFDLLTSMTTLPLRLLNMLGVIIALIGLGFAALLLILRAIYGTAWAAQGVFTLFAILFFFIGCQFVGMGLLGEYIGRIYQDVRARPQYFIQRIVGREDAEEQSDSTGPRD